MSKMQLRTKGMNGVLANLKQYGRDAVARVKALMPASMDRTYEIAQQLCPVDSGYQKRHMLHELHESELGYSVGFRSEDFVGQVNPATGETITYPYFLVNEFGNRDGTHPAQPCILPAGEVERPRLRRAVREALKRQ